MDLFAYIADIIVNVFTTSEVSTIEDADRQTKANGDTLKETPEKAESLTSGEITQKNEC